MLHWASLFLVATLIAMYFGFAGSVVIMQVFTIAFCILFAFSLVFGWRARVL